MTTNKVRAVQWAQNVSDASDIDTILEGAKAIEQFLIATGSCVEIEQDAALGAASTAWIRSGDDESYWNVIVANAHKVFEYLTGATSSTQPAPAAIAEPGSEAA